MTVTINFTRALSGKFENDPIAIGTAKQGGVKFGGRTITDKHVGLASR
jgi:hypothetical protein